MSGQVLLYGATGYTGALLAWRMSAMGLTPILAGRDGAKLARLAAEMGDAPWRAFALDDPAEIAEGLAGCEALVLAAGPIAGLAPSVMDACLSQGVHYLDISGEWRVSAAALERSAQAQRAGVMIMPAAGFTVAAGDCLLALAAAGSERPASLRLALSWPMVIARGTVLTAAADATASQLVRRDGRLAGVPLGRVTRAFDFGEGLRNATLVGLPEVIAAGFTTGVDTIETYMEADAARRLGFVATAACADLLGRGPMEALAQIAAAAWPATPTLAQRQAARYDLVVEALDRWRRPATWRMRTLDGYSVTLAVVPHIVQRVLGGGAKAGFQTPSSLCGPDVLFELGCAALDPRSASRREAVDG
jgi:short subunit dehydrogenase-like uncharacterized protein